MKSRVTSLDQPRADLFGIVGAAWGVVGISVLLLGGVFSVLPHALELELGQLGWLEWAALVGYCAFMAVGKGYFGFQRGFSPRSAGRLLELKHRPRPLAVVLAPVYGMSLIMAPRARVLRSWALVLIIAAIVPVVGRLPQPWRGIVDVGVIVGLAWGLASFWWFVSQGRTPARG